MFEHWTKNKNLVPKKEPDDDDDGDDDIHPHVIQTHRHKQCALKKTGAFFYFFHLISNVFRLLNRFRTVQKKTSL